MTVPSYRERLALEGGVLAGCGVVGSALLLTLVEGSQDGPENTAGQLAVVGALCAWWGPRSARRWTRSAQPAGDDPGSGEPTPLWQLPLITAGLSLLVALPPPHLWDAALRVTGGCALVGATQALVMAPIVKAEERRHGRRYLRLPGSRLARGTRLGYVPAD